MSANRTVLYFAVNIPNIDNGLAMSQFEEIIRDYVRVRAKEYYQWKDYQNSIQYAGEHQARQAQRRA